MTGPGRSLHNIPYRTRGDRTEGPFQRAFLLAMVVTATVACSRPAPTPEAAAAPSGPVPAAQVPNPGAVPSPPAGPVAEPGLPSPSGPTGPSGLAGATGPSGDPGPAPLPQLPPLPVESVEARLGAVVAPLSGPGSEPVDPGATFEVRLPVGTRGARLVLLDAQDALVPSSSESEVAAGRSRYTLVPIEPLRTGTRYVLRLEGVESRQVISDDGRPHEPLAVPFLVSGEPPPKAAPPKKGQKKRPR